MQADFSVCPVESGSPVKNSVGGCGYFPLGSPSPDQGY